MGDPEGVRSSWPAVTTCRLAPLALLAVALLVPILRWSALPKNKPGGWLLFAMAWSLGGLLIIAPQMWRPRGWAPEQWTGLPAHWIGPSGLAMGWLRSRFGPAAAGIYALAFGAGLSVVTTSASAHSRTWRMSPAGFLVSLLAALPVAALAGLVVRNFGRLVDRDGRYV